MPLEDLIFSDFEIRCRKCNNLFKVSLEDLRLNSEVICPHCEAEFNPDLDMDKILKMIKSVEDPNVQKIYHGAFTVEELREHGQENPESREWVNNQLKSLGEPVLDD